MVKTVNKMLTMFLCLLLPLGAGAQDTHWKVDPYTYQYDMTAYVVLQTTDGKAIADYSDYEIAAFCGDECRGVATILTAEKDDIQKQYGYLRIRSNQQQGETITFKVYNKMVKTETDIENISITFKSQNVVGLPSNPFVLEAEFVLVIPGDVNGDGAVDVADIAEIIDVMAKGTNDAKADVNGDGAVDVADISAIISIMAGETDNTYGDVNGDGSVDVADIATVIDVMAGKALEYKDKADVNKDNSVDVADIATIIDIMAGNARRLNNDD